MPSTASSNLHLQAETDTVEGLVALVRRGAVRIPDFQRPLRWTAEDVKTLFDSIYHGYPIGSFLMRKASAEAAVVHYGPLEVVAPDTHSAWWVVDGQQRLTALAAGLARQGPTPDTPDDPWVLYFDARSKTFQVPPTAGGVPSTWVPVSQLLDASSLSEWVFNWTHNTDSALRRSVFDAGARIRQYEIPLYVVETQDEDLLRQIFYRINNSGAPLRWEEIHDALFGRKAEHPSTLRSLADELEKLGVGRPDENQLLSCVVAFKGLDVTRSIADHYQKDPDVLRDAVQDALPSIRRVLLFLKDYAEIPHLRLLPRSLPLVILTRFFGVYPEPNGRTTELLTRWTWRTLFSITGFDERTLLRHGVSSIHGESEEDSTQRLLAILPRQHRDAFAFPKRFDARAADSRIVLVAMSTLKPRRLVDGRPIDIANLIEERDIEAFRRVVRSPHAVSQSPANRILLPLTSGSVQRELRELINTTGPKSDILSSHGISAEAAIELSEGRLEQFLALRQTSLERAVSQLGERLAGWAKNDRPSLKYLLSQVQDDE